MLIFRERDIPVSTGMSLFLLYTVDMVVYLDYIFLVHLLVNMVIFGLLRSSILEKVRRKRYWLGLVVYSLLQVPKEVILLRGHWNWFGLFYDFAVLQIAIWFCFHPKEMRMLLKRNIQLGICTVILGGILLAIEEYFQVSFSYMLQQRPMLFLCCYLISAVLASGLVKCLFLWKRQQENIKLVMLHFLHREYVVMAYWDSGNCLNHPITGAPVMIGYYGFFREKMPDIHRELLDDYFAKGCLDYEKMLKHNVQDLQVINCVSVGGEQKLPILPVRYRFQDKTSKVQKREVYLAFSNLPLSKDGSYAVLLHRDL